MSWGTHRRNTIIGLFFIGIFIPVAGIAFLLFYETPNCFDVKQNGTETGVDCGGSCQLLCTNQMVEPVVLWEKAFRVSNGVYNLFAYIENPNPTAYVRNAEYLFKMYNEENVLIGEKKGVVSFAPKSIRPVIESNIETFEQVPRKVTFEFTNSLVYEQTQPEESVIVIKDEFIERTDTSPRVKAKIQNLSLGDIYNIEVIVLIYDVFDNVLGTSSTFVNMLSSEEIKDIVFTWPQSFPDEVGRIELIPIYDIK